MFTGVQFTHFIQANPALAVFLTVALGFLLGKLRIRSFSLGTVTSVLLVGVVVGQLRIEIPEPAKTLFFLMFLFAVGYAVGPQFFRGLKKDGLPQVAFAVVVCLLCLGSVWLFSWLMGYTLSQAAGLLAGSQTMSAVLGVATDTIRQLPEAVRYDQRAAGRSGNRSQLDACLLCGDLHLRYGGFRLGAEFDRTPVAGRRGEGEAVGA